MAYIESFSVSGLAGKQGVVSEVLHRHINIFWGLNGSGKTSLLKILSSAMRNDVALLNQVAFTSAEVIFRSTDHDVSIRRTITKDPDEVFVMDDDIEDVPSLESVGEGLWRERDIPQKMWTTSIIDGHKIARPNQRFRHTYLPISRISAGSSIANRYGEPRPTQRQAMDDASLAELFARQVRRKWQLYNSEALGTIRSIQQQGLAEILAVLFGGAQGGSEASETTLEAEEAYGLVTAFLNAQRIRLKLGQARFIERYNSDANLRHVVARIQEVTDEVEITLRPQREFQDIIAKLYSGGKQVTINDDIPQRAAIEISTGETSIPLESLSSGEKQLLQLMLETLAAETNVIMIDEPELSMHVDWQQKLVESMRRINPHCQLLLATHSPEVMAEVDDDYVFELWATK